MNGNNGGGQSERETILGALQAAGNNRSRAAKILGIPRSTLLDRIAKLGIKPEGEEDA